MLQVILKAYFTITMHPSKIALLVFQLQIRERALGKNHASSCVGACNMQLSPLCLLSEDRRDRRL